MPAPAYTSAPRAYHSPEQTEFVRVLAPYLAEQIDVFCPGRNRYGRLVGLPVVTPGERPYADVRLYQTERERQTNVLFDLAEPICNVLPVLRPFEDLAKQLPDGTLPALEVARRVWPECFKDRKIDECEVLCDSEWCQIFTKTPAHWSAKGTVSVIVNKNGDTEFANECPGANQVDTLRQLQIAVGLRPEQFHRMPSEG